MSNVEGTYDLERFRVGWAPEGRESVGDAYWML